VYSDLAIIFTTTTTVTYRRFLIQQAARRLASRSFAASPHSTKLISAGFTD